MKIPKLSFYAFIFAIVLIFIKILTQTYLNFFNKNGENKTIIISELQSISLPSECNLEMNLPKVFSSQKIIKISFKSKCEDEAINEVAKSFADSQAQKKFIRLAMFDSKSYEIKWQNEDSFFNIQTIAVKVDRDNILNTTTIHFKNLNKVKS